MDPVPSEGHCYIDELPDEVFAQILNLVPFKHVIRCSIVSKRWDAACKYIIRTRESLVIGYYDSDRPFVRCDRGSDQERLSLQMNGITFRSVSLVSAMRSLNQMVELRRLCVIATDAIITDLIPFVRKFTEQLTMLEIDIAMSQIDADAFPHLTRLECDCFDVDSSAAFPKLTQLTICDYIRHGELLNMRLPILKKLVFLSSYPTDRDKEPIREFIRSNAETLTVLEMRCMKLRLDHAVVFPNLNKVDCLKVDVVAGCSFPALTHLTVWGAVTAEFLSSLPAEQMRSLEIAFYDGGKDVVSAVSKMRSLKSLMITDGGWDEAHATFGSIFDNVHHLEEVKLAANFFHKEQDGMIAKLANQNPKLSHVYFKRIGLADADLTSLAQLQLLTDVRISDNKKVTTAGILTLLRGSSRNVIRKFAVDAQNVDGDQVTSEIRLMCEERGTTCVKTVTPHPRGIKYVINC